MTNIETALVESTDQLVGQLQAEVKQNGFTSRVFAERGAGSTHIELRTDELADTVSGVRAGKGRYKRKQRYK